MVKDKHIISELKTFFHKNDCNKAINCKRQPDHDAVQYPFFHQEV